MDYLFDQNDEESRIREKIEEYYGEFSDNARNKLFSKNIQRPNSAYDLVNKRQREFLMSKNQTNIVNDLDKNSNEIRDFLLSKNLLESFDLLANGELHRKSLQARNNILKSSDGLLDVSEKIRKGLLSTNKVKDNELLSQFDSVRQGLISKNVAKETDVYEQNKQTRESNISKNKTSEVDNLRDSEVIRDGNLSKNVVNDFSLEKISENHRDKQKKKNLESNSDLSKISNQLRSDMTAKNVVNNQISLDLLFESFREMLVSKSFSENIDLMQLSHAFRDALISKNVENKNTIEELFDKVRSGLLSRNKTDEKDLLKDSELFKESNVSKNTINQVDLEKISQPIRESILSGNILIKNEELVDVFDFIRDKLVSSNKTKNIDLLTVFETQRSKLLSFNKAKTTDLSNDSQDTRDVMLSSNGNLKEVDLEKISQIIREDLVSKNNVNTTNLEEESSSFRESLLSNNKPKVTDLEVNSEPFREDLLSNNKPKVTDLEVNSEPFRENLLSNNKPKITDVEKDSVDFRDDLLASNIHKTTDLEKDSVDFRDDLLASNVHKITDLEKDSVDFRDDLLASNVHKTTDLEKDSVDFRDDLLSSNVHKTTDLEKDSVDFRDDLLASNVHKTTDLEKDSVDFRDDLLASNVHKITDLEKDSGGFYVNNITRNSVSENNLLLDSIKLREKLITSNKPKTSDLLFNSELLRKELLSRNIGGLLGVNVESAGTSTFIGVSRVLFQGFLHRKFLTLRNKYSLIGNEYSKETDLLINLPKAIEEKNKMVSDTAKSMLFSLDTSNSGALALFGTGVRPTNSAFDKYRDGKFYGDSKSISSPKSDQVLNATIMGSVTEAIRILNISKNAFSVTGIDGLRNSGGYEYLKNLLIDSQIDSQGNYLPELFKDMIQKTIGSFEDISNLDYGTPTTPHNIIVQNGGKYVNLDPEIILSQDKSGDIESNPKILAAQQVFGNPFDDEDFRKGNRGVKRVINLIKKSDLNFASNYNPQGNDNQESEYTTLKNGQSQKVKQRWSIRNPYAPKNAKGLHFMLQNYSNGQKMYFPPYIESFSHSSSANWNEVNFLGRPEPLYTYNNTKRSGSISFFVLTDYATSVDIGLTEQEEFNQGFTQKIDFSDIDIEIKKIEKDIEEINVQLNIASGKGETQELEQNKQELLKEKGNLLIQKQFLRKGQSQGGNYFEKNTTYKDVIDGEIINNSDGTISRAPEDTKKRLDEMKAQLMFQPAYFSGDQNDFLKRMEFLEKMVRPSRLYHTKKLKADETPLQQTKNGTIIGTNAPGFSFINPPVCHIHIGDWINHDIVIRSIDYNYDNAPWALGNNDRVQPMWCKVTMQFDILGRYKHAAGDAVTSTDRGGFFSI